jgi:hypothetical protein
MEVDQVARSLNRASDQDELAFAEQLAEAISHKIRHSEHEKASPGRDAGEHQYPEGLGRSERSRKNMSSITAKAESDDVVLLTSTQY